MLSSVTSGRSGLGKMKEKLRPAAVAKKCACHSGKKKLCLFVQLIKVGVGGVVHVHRKIDARIQFSLLIYVAGAKSNNNLAK